MKVITLILIGFFATFCSEQQTLLEQVRQSGELRVVTRSNRTTCCRIGDRLIGFECSLAQRFADELGVRLTMVFVENDNQIVDAINRGEGHLAVGLKANARHGESIHFGPHYQQIRQQIVYRRGKERLNDPADLTGKRLEVAPGHGYKDKLRALAEENQDFTWQERPSLTTTELLSLVLKREVDVTIADSNEITLMRQLYPELSVAFDVGHQPLAWAFPSNADDSLYVKALVPKSCSADEIR